MREWFTKSERATIIHQVLYSQVQKLGAPVFGKYAMLESLDPWISTCNDPGGG